MKRVKLAFICLMMTVVVSANTTNTVSRDTKIFHTLKNSGILTDVNGKIVDSRANAHLLPGEQIYLKFQDGFDTVYTAKAGDNPWAVTGSLIDYLEPLHKGLVVDNTEKAKANTVAPATGNNAGANVPTMNILAMLASVPSWVWMFLVLLAAGAIWYAINRYQKRLAKKAADAVAETERVRIANDPVLAGPPVVPNGITEENAAEVMTNAAQTSFGTTLPVTIHSMERGTINAQSALVFFNGRQSKDNMRVTNRRGVRAIVTIGDETERRTVYALAECGNPLRVGNWIEGEGIVFTPDSVGANIPVQERNAQEVATANNGKPTLVSFMEMLPTVMPALESSQTTTVKFTSKEGASVEITLEAKKPATVLPAKQETNTPVLAEEKK